MKKKFAFLLMGGDYDPTLHQTLFETDHCVTGIFTVRNGEEAVARVLELQQEGFGAIELCGAFGEEGAKKLVALTKNKIAIGYVTHDPALESLFNTFFS